MYTTLLISDKLVASIYKILYSNISSNFIFYLLKVNLIFILNAVNASLLLNPLQFLMFILLSKIYCQLMKPLMISLTFLNLNSLMISYYLLYKLILIPY